MKKLPTLFVRDFGDRGMFTLTDQVEPGMEWVIEGKGKATMKVDGSC